MRRPDWVPGGLGFEPTFSASEKVVGDDSQCPLCAQKRTLYRSRVNVRYVPKADSSSMSRESVTGHRFRFPSALMPPNGHFLACSERHTSPGNYAFAIFSLVDASHRDNLVLNLR
jgi:hypothetical protein